MALVVPERGRPDGQDWPRPTFVAIGTPGRSISIEAGQIGAFLKKHEDVSIACLDVDAIFWSLEGCLRSDGDWIGHRALFSVAAACRLHDVQIFHQLLLLALYGTSGDRLKLDALVDFYKKFEHAGWQVDDGPGGACRELSEGPGPGQIEVLARADAELVRKVYLAQKNLADQMAGLSDIDDGIVDLFGPLSVGLQSQGAVALGRMSRGGLRLLPGAIPSLRRRCEEAYRDCSRRLLADGVARKAFKKTGKAVTRDGRGFPSQRNIATRDWLARELLASSGTFDIPPEPPRTLDGQVSIYPEFWGDIVRLRPRLQDWAKLWSAATILKALDESDERGDGMLRPSYQLFPRLRSRSPGLEELRRLQTEPTFEAEPGHILLAGRLGNLTLHSQATLSHQTGTDSHLGGMLSGGVDPKETVAKWLYVREVARQGRSGGDPWNWETAEEFEQLPENDPDRQRLSKLADALLEVMLNGLDHASAREVMDRDYGVDLRVDQVEVYWHHVIDILPDLWRWLGEDRTLELASKHLRCDEDELREALTGETQEAKALFLRNLISGRRDDPQALARLAEICRNESLSGRLGRKKVDPQLYRDLFQDWAVTGTGRLRKGVFFSRGRAAQHLELAEDAMKSALFGLIAAGYEPVAWTGSEFLIQVGEQGDIPAVVRRVKEVAEKSVRPVLHQFLPPFHVKQVLQW